MQEARRQDGRVWRCGRMVWGGGWVLVLGRERTGRFVLRELCKLTMSCLERGARNLNHPIQNPSTLSLSKGCTSPSGWARGAKKRTALRQAQGRRVWFRILAPRSNGREQRLSFLKVSKVGASKNSQTRWFPQRISSLFWRVQASASYCFSPESL